jgi:hypothetical protein
MEAVLSKSLRHPNIVSTLAWRVVAGAARVAAPREPLVGHSLSEPGAAAPGGEGSGVMPPPAAGESLGEEEEGEGQTWIGAPLGVREQGPWKRWAGAAACTASVCHMPTHLLNVAAADVGRTPIPPPHARRSP